MKTMMQVCCMAVLVSAAALVTTPASALTMAECSAKYKAAKDGGTLNGQKWNDFRKAQCGADATPAAATAAAPAAAAPKADASAKTAAAPKADAKTAAAPAAPATPAGPAVYPSKVDPKYASESVGKGRMHTCRDQYAANKTTNANGGMKWIEKGGGYWSGCDKALKGST
jgi:hypothetical protein